MKQKYKNTLAFWVVATLVYILAAMFIIQGETLDMADRFFTAFLYFSTVGLFTTLFYLEQD